MVNVISYDGWEPRLMGRRKMNKESGMPFRVRQASPGDGINQTVGEPSSNPFWIGAHRWVLGCCLSVFLLGLLLIGASAQASTTYVDGISDQSIPSWDGGFSGSYFAGFFQNTWINPAPHIQYARYVVQWNVMYKPSEKPYNEEPYVHYRQEFEEWVNDAADMGLALDLAVTDYPSSNTSYPSSSAEYKSRVKEVLAQANAQGHPISYLEPWNEPNGQGGESAVAAAHFANEGNAACKESPKCTVVAGNVEDASSVKGYLEGYREALNFTPSNWGVHPYQSVEYREKKYYEGFLEGLPNKGSGDHIWFTEVAARRCTASKNNGEIGQAERAEWLVDTLIPYAKPEHVFYWEFLRGYREQPTCAETDDALYLPSSDPNAPDAPRPAAAFIYGDSGFPWGYTGGTTSVSPRQATLTGSVYPGGFLTATYHFEYWPTGGGIAYSAEGNAGSGTGMVAASIKVSKLEPATTYHYRIVAWNTKGSSTGKEGSFSTPGEPPVNTSAPTIEVSGSELMVGQSVSASLGTWEGTPPISYTYQWNTCTGSSCSPVAGATASTYTPVQGNGGKSLTVTVTATNAWGSANATSAPTSPILGDGPSMVAADGGVSVTSQDVNDALYATTSDFAQNTWQSALLGPAGTIDSAPSSVADSSGDIWTAFEGVDNQLWIGVDAPSGGWGMSYEGPSNTTYSAPSTAIDSNKNVWVATEGPNHTLNLAEDSANKWVTSTPITAADVYSAPSVVADSGGDIWVAFQGPGNQLWVGVDSPTGGWGMSYEGPSNTTYSAPSTAIDSNKNVWVATEGPNHTLNLAELAANKWVTSTPITAADVYSAPSVVADSGGDIWVAFRGPGNQLWVGVDSPTGGWGMSYQGSSNTTYSAPSAVIDSAGNIWVGAEGSNSTLAVTGRLKTPGTWKVSFEGTPDSASVDSAPSLVNANNDIAASTQGVTGGLYMTTSDFAQNRWQSALLGPAGTIDSAPSSVADSSGDIWTAFEGVDNQLWIGVDAPSGGWGMSYEGPSNTTYSAPSTAIDSNKNVWVATEGPNHTLNLAEDSANKWVTSTPITAADVYSAPSVVADSGGDIWVAFQGPGNQLWVGVDSPTGGWGMSYEGPSNTTYSAPSTAIDSNKNVWVATEGPNHTLNLAELAANKWVTSTPITAADVYSAPSVVADSGGDIWVAFRGPGNQLWVGVDSPTGGWGMSYQGSSNTTYSAPSAVIDSAGNIWVGAEGSNNTLIVTVRSKTLGTWEISYQGG